MKSFISLFSGCGGFDLGAVQAGFTPEFAIDNDPNSVETYLQNFGSHVQLGDIGSLNPKKYPLNPDLLIGGPPCQGFSSAGPKEADDPRNKLWEAYLDAVKVTRPKAFVLENVTGFQKELPGFVNALNNSVGKLYHVEARKLIAQYYGVPQFRYRLFVIGILKDVCDQVPWPEPVSKEVFSYTRTFDGMITIEDAISDLGPPSESSDPEHVHVPLNAVDAKIASHIPNGGSLKDIPDPHLPKPYRNRKRGNRGWTWFFRKPRTSLPGRTVLASIRPTYATILFPDVVSERHEGIFRWSAITIEDHINSDGLYVSPVPQRRLTVRECARLQGFPDDFLFCGDLLQKHKMIGNAVPCELAKRICEAISYALDGVGEFQQSQRTFF